MMRRPLARTVGATVALAVSLSLAAPAHAAPGPAPGPAHAAAEGDAVLIVHVADSRPVGSLLRQLGRLDLRHTFGALHAFSVGVPASQVTREAERLAALPGVTAVERSVRRSYAGIPATDDQYLYRQRAYLDAVRAPQAWAAQKSSPKIKIAVLDSGVDVNHPDLAGKIAPGGTYDAHDHSTDVTDEVGHGTFVAGVAAADTNNGTGVAGAGYDASIYAVKIADPDGAIELDDEVAGIRWATAQHVDVINLSLGGPDRSAAEEAAIEDARKAGIFVVAAAGNESDTTRSYPAAYPGVIAVGATDSSAGTRASFSNYGRWVTVAAPGVHVYSTVPTAGSQMWATSDGYAYGDGTSFSTPLVAGELALLKAQNPHAGVAAIRHALVASAHGYGGLGLGAGQVDFALALKHVPPVSVPTNLAVTGSAGRVRLTARSSAPKVAFRIDSDAPLRPVGVTDGAAGASFATWGYPNGAHQLRAFACTAYDECSAAGADLSFTIGNPTPTVTAPAAHATVTGRFAVTAANPAGGPLQLIVDGHRRGAVRSAPYAFTISASSLADGPHVLQVRGCSLDYARCAGPRSAAVAVTAAGLHPRVVAVAPSHVSPNGDHRHDTAVLRFQLPDTETVHVRVLDHTGATVRSFSLGSLAAGAHRWTWRALGPAGHRLPDGRYTLVLDTAGGTKRGWVTAPAIVDTARPALARPSGNGARVYPVRDGFRDSFTTRTRLGEAGRLTLTVRTGGGRLVRTLRSLAAPGAASVTWDGRNAHGARAPAGTYRWALSLTDLAGNTTRRGPYRLTVSAKRLVDVVEYVTKDADRYAHAGGTARCAYARPRESSYAGGLRLVNTCAANGFDLAFADYAFQLPPAMRYSSLAFQVRGVSQHRPSELTVAFSRTDGSVEIPRYLTVTSGTASWYTIAAVPAAQHVGRYDRARMSLLLDSYYRGRNDFDTAKVRLRVRMTVLR